MAAYSPLKITGYSTGLVQERENFLLPDDAYPVLQNAYVWREKIKRKKGYQLLGRLQRFFTATPGNTDAMGDFATNMRALFSLEPGATIVPGTFTAVVGAKTYTEVSPPNGLLLENGVPAALGTFLNYASTNVGLVTMLPFTAVTLSFFYYPALPVMGIRTQELQAALNDQTLVFDQKYAYVFDSASSAYKEYIPGTTWNASNVNALGTDFFWSTNYWVGDLVNFPMGTPDAKLFWVTNNTGRHGAASDPIRITNGTIWIDFVPPTYGQINASPEYFVNCLAFLPFRGRLVAFNTWEGSSIISAHNFPNRIRWSTIGNPFIPFTAGPPARGSWRDDIRGQGGFLDIPTSEDIVAVGFVRDNLVIYCERSTWQLRYTGRSIAPFQIERVNSELGAESTFSAIQFDTSLLGIGDKGIVECDSYKSERVDVKIPDLVFQFQQENNGAKRIQGVRDFVSRLAYWTFPAASQSTVFPTQRIVYNYENDSWALFDDSLTALGTYQVQSGRTWLNTKQPWIECLFSWIEQPEQNPVILGGNQQGFVEQLDELTTNDVSLSIDDITANITTATVITCTNHNMKTGFVISITSIPVGTPFDGLNGGIFGIVVIDANHFQLMIYDPNTYQFSIPRLDTPAVYVGLGLIKIRENFSITSKKFNFLDEGQSIQLGYLDILLTANEALKIMIINTPGSTDKNGNFDTNLRALFNLPNGSTLVPGLFRAVVGPNTYTETRPPSGRLLVNGYPAPLGTIVEYASTRVGLVTQQPFTAVDLTFSYYPVPLAQGEISINVFLDYDDVNASNTLPNNDINDNSQYGNPDTFFNSVINTTQSPLSNIGGTKFWQRVYCSTQANFLTIQYTFNNAQLNSTAQQQDIQIDAQVLWIRKGGRMTSL